MKQTTKHTSILVPTAIAALLTLPCGVSAQDMKPIELRYTSSAPAKGNPWVTQIERLAKDVDEESKGELKIQPFLNATLGSEQDTVQQVVRGRIDMGGYTLGATSTVVPEMALLMMPFYFSSVAEMDCVLDNHMLKPTTELFDKRGIKFLGWMEVGSIEFFGKKTYTSPKDLAGAKAAMYANKVFASFYSTLGASPIPLGTPEWIPAFQTGMVDVVMTPITFAVPSGLSKVATVSTRMGAFDTPSLTLINKASFEKLPKHLQDALQKAVARTTAAQARTEVRGFEAVLHGMHEKAGGQTVALTQPQRDAWRKELESLYPKMVEDTGGTAKTFFAAMEAGRKACTK